MIGDNEIRFVHREETFTDLAVRELAESCSACMCRLQFKRCTEDECQNCQEGIAFRSCYGQMSDYDRQRFNSYLRQAYLRNSEHPEMWRTFKGLIGQVLRYILLFIISIVLIALLLHQAFEYCDMPNKRQIKDSYASISQGMNHKVIDNIRYTHYNIYDITADGKKNCQDYTILFYLFWQDRYPEDKDRVFFVRNKNAFTGMNHMFIYMVDYDGKGFYLEPWANDCKKYLMFDNWDSFYDSSFNVLMPEEHYLKRAVNAGFRLRWSKEPE